LILSVDIVSAVSKVELLFVSLMLNLLRFNYVNFEVSFYVRII